MNRSVHDVAERYLDAARTAAVDAVVRIVEDTSEEIFARSGEVEFEGETTELLVGLQIVHGGRAAFVTAPLSASPEAVVARARAALRLLPDVAAVPPRTPHLPAAPEPAQGERLAEARTELVELARAERAVQVEVRCVSTTRRLFLATSVGARGSYWTGRATLELRCTASVDGRVANVSETDVSRDITGLVDRLRLGGRARCLDLVQVLTTPPTTVDLPDTVLLDGYVAAQLVKFLAVSFSAEAVAQGRSRLDGAVGELIASELVHLVDDPVRADLPMAAPFDDEGEPAHGRALVVAGRLTGYPANRRFAGSVVGSAAGSAWQQSATTPPRPGTRNLWLQPAERPLETPGPVLRIVQTRGMHISNEVTGDFAMGASGVVEDGSERRAVPPLTIAGNVFDLLHQIERSGDRLRWSPASVGSYGSPDLLVRGLAVGM